MRETATATPSNDGVREELGTSESSTLAAFVAVAHHHGVAARTDALRRAHPFQTAEPATALIAVMAKLHGLVAQPLRLQRGDLIKLSRTVPAILRFPDDRSLLLLRVEQRDGVTLAMVHDPLAAADAVVAVDEARLYETWAGDVVLVKRRWRLSDQEQPFSLQWLVGQTLLEKSIFRDILLASAASAVFAMAPAFVFMTIVNRVLLNNAMNTLNVIAVGVAFLLMFDTLFGYLRRYIINKV